MSRGIQKEQSRFVALCYATCTIFSNLIIFFFIIHNTLLYVYVTSEEVIQAISVFQSPKTKIYIYIFCNK